MLRNDQTEVRSEDKYSYRGASIYGHAINSTQYLSHNFGMC